MLLKNLPFCGFSLAGCKYRAGIDAAKCFLKNSIVNFIKVGTALGLRRKKNENDFLKIDS
jgi:hypothetical protein